MVRTLIWNSQIRSWIHILNKSFRIHDSAAALGWWVCGYLTECCVCMVQGVEESLVCDEVGLTVHNMATVPGHHYNLTTLHLSSEVRHRPRDSF